MSAALRMLPSWLGLGLDRRGAVRHYVGKSTDGCVCAVTSVIVRSALTLTL